MDKGCVTEPEKERERERERERARERGSKHTTRHFVRPKSGEHKTGISCLAASAKAAFYGHSHHSLAVKKNPQTEEHDVFVMARVQGTMPAMALRWHRWLRVSPFLLPDSPCPTNLPRLCCWWPSCFFHCLLT